MALTVLDLPALRRWVVAARADLAVHAEAINRLNVFPVPDADTGTNMLVTLDEAIREVTALHPQEVPESVAALSRATLSSARGNSGVILSQLVRGVAEVVQDTDNGQLDGPGLARALARASELAWAGVTRPVEGTVLSVAAAAAAGARQAPSPELTDVCRSALVAARTALLATEDELEVLRLAGVVDAGGGGYLLVLEALERVVEAPPSGPVRPRGEVPEWLTRVPVETSAARAEGDCAATGGGPAYEVMFLLDASDAPRVEQLKQELDPLGDSLVVAGGPDLWSVHVHVDDVSAALNAGAAAGRPHRFAVTRFGEQLPPAPTDGYGVLVVGDGLAGLVAHVGRSDVIVADIATVRAQPGTIVELLRGIRAERVLALADSTDAAGLAQEAARIAGRDMTVIGDHPVHVLAGLAVLDPADDRDRAAATAQDAIADVRTVPVGEPLDIDAVVAEIGTRLKAGGELVTVVRGAPRSSDSAADIMAAVSAEHPEAEVMALDSDARGWALAVGVE
ncbi:DAK2 domain-containing protein [Luteipulveratus mongoliensis]|uniref:DAK2 domain-containing protein n=1 Tax=Luteipulveratus mongoliensis TaxID=571913 RepID=UPI000A85B117|nr:DAK2 domain-containing protein [Luteipulveratus mongoliensis]